MWQRTFVALSNDLFARLFICAELLALLALKFCFSKFFFLTIVISSVFVLFEHRFVKKLSAVAFCFMHLIAKLVLFTSFLVGLVAFVQVIPFVMCLFTCAFFWIYLCD